MGLALTIGDGIVDLIRDDNGKEEWHPGGAALNLAVGLSRLGHQSVLAGRIGADRDGFRVMRYLRDEGVRLINFPTADFTGVAISERQNGEPRYRFNAAMYRRRVVFTAELMAALAQARVVAVNTFPFQSLSQAEELVAARGDLAGLFIVDPNPRPNLVRDLSVFRRGFELNLPGCFLVKLSVEDVGLLYGGEEADAVARIQSLGAQRVLLTRGAGGASLFMSDEAPIHVGSAVSAGEVVDTMGAGDATLAAVIDWLLRRGVPDGAQAWKACLERAMRIAGATCKSNGGGLVFGGEMLVG